MRDLFLQKMSQKRLNADEPNILEYEFYLVFLQPFDVGPNFVDLLDTHRG